MASGGKRSTSQGSTPPSTRTSWHKQPPCQNLRQLQAQQDLSLAQNMVAEVANGNQEILNSHPSTQQIATHESTFFMPNPFLALENADENMDLSPTPKVVRSRPIFIRNLKHFKAHCSYLDKTIDSGKYTCINRSESTFAALLH